MLAVATDRPIPQVAKSLGTATIENRAPRGRRVMQMVTLPLADSDGVRLSDTIQVLDSGTGQPEVCQVESWAMRYPSGNERIVRLHYPAVLPASNIRIQHTFEKIVGTVPAPAFVLHPNVARGLAEMTIRFFCGPKATYWTTSFQPGQQPVVLVDGPHMRKLRFFSRVYRPTHAPTLETQFWNEVDLYLYSGMPYANAHVRWGVDDPRVNWDGEERSGLTDEETEVGFDFLVQSIDRTRPQPIQPHTNVQSLTWDGSKWRWVWDRRTLTNGNILNHRYPWGVMLQAQVAITFAEGLTGIDADSCTAWIESPFYHWGVSDKWLLNQEAYGPVGALMRRRKRHEHWLRNRDASFVRGQLEIESWNMAQARSSRDGGAMYAWDHRVGHRARCWHSNDGQSPGNKDWWSKTPHYEAIAYSVPSIAHVHQAGTYICPWFYFYKEVDGRILSAVDHPELNQNRGNPNTWGTTGVGYRHGKHFEDNGWSTGSMPRWTGASGSQVGFLMRDPTTGTSGLVGSDNAHFEAPHFFSGAAIFGDDGVRETARMLAHHFHASGSYAATPVGVGEGRNWSRSAVMWAWSIWLFGTEAPGLIDLCADNYLIRRTLSEMALLDAQYPGRVIQSPWIHGPEGSSPPTFVALNRYPYFRPWENVHAATGELGIARLAEHIRSELAWFRTHAQQTAADVLRYGSPKKVNETTGVVEFEFVTSRGIRGISVAAALADGNGSRQLSAAEMADNNTVRCGWTGSNPPNPDCADANNGYMRLPFFGDANAFALAMAWMVLDGPLSAGDVVLQRYINSDSLPYGWENPGGSTPHLDWFWPGQRWSAHRVDQIAKGAATTRGTHGVATIRDIAHSRQFPGTIWITRTNTEELQRRDLATGALLQSVTPSQLGLFAWTGICTVTLGGTNMLALLDGRDDLANRSSYRVVVVLESDPTITIASWLFQFEDLVSRNTCGLVWCPASNDFLVAGNGGPENSGSVWRLGVNATLAQRRSLPMTPTSAATIIIDSQYIQGLASTQDGVLLAVTDTVGGRNYYAWNKPSALWGIPRLKTTGATPACCFSLHERDADELRVLSAAAGGAFVEEEI